MKKAANIIKENTIFVILILMGAIFTAINPAFIKVNNSEYSAAVLHYGDSGYG